MRRSGGLVLVGAMLAWMPCALLAQDGLSNEELKRMYDDSVVQLKSAQDRRNELARENAQLKARIAELEKNLEQTRAAADVVADKTYQSRAQHEAFADFLQANPSIRVQWQRFLERNLLVNPRGGDLLDRDWPLSCRR
jgi:septal ring factor EnvC (AmiA/AmiB activator)